MNVILNKIAFQQDAYRPLVDRISQHALLRGVPGRGREGVPGLGGGVPGLGWWWYPSMH